MAGECRSSIHSHLALFLVCQVLEIFVAFAVCCSVQSWLFTVGFESFLQKHLPAVAVNNTLRGVKKQRCRGMDS